MWLFYALALAVLAWGWISSNSHLTNSLHAYRHISSSDNFELVTKHRNSVTIFTISILIVATLALFSLYLRG